MKQQIEYIENLRFLPSAGPIRGHRIKAHLLPFQRRILEACFSGKNVFVGHSRKISKSFLYGLAAQAVLDLQKGKNIICVGGTAEQADYVYNNIRMQIAVNPKIPESRYMISKDRIYNKETHSSIHRIHSKAISALGSGPDIIIADELGAWQSGQLMNILESGQGMSENPQTWAASNPAPYETHWSVEWIKSLSNDPAWKVFDYGSPAKADPFSEKTWARANPFLRVYLQNKKKHKIFKPLHEFFKKEADKAKKSGEQLTKFRRYLVGQKIDENLATWINISDLKGCDESPLKNKKARWIASFDIAFSRDFCAFTLIGFHDDKIFVFPIAHLANTAERTFSQRKLFEGWHRDGFIKIQNRPSISKDIFCDDVKAFLEKHKITPDYFVFDRALSEGWHQEFTGEPVLHSGKASEMTLGVRHLEARAKDGKIHIHKQNPAMLFCLRNAIVSMRAKNFCLLQRPHWRSSIDLAVCLAIGASQHLKEPHQEFFMDVIPQPGLTL